MLSTIIDAIWIAITLCQECGIDAVYLTPCATARRWLRDWNNRFHQTDSTTITDIYDQVEEADSAWQAQKQATGMTARCKDCAQEMWKIVSEKWSHIFPSANAHVVAKAFCNNMKRLGGKEFLAHLSDSVDYLRKDIPDTAILVMDMHAVVQLVLPLIEKIHKTEPVKFFLLTLSKFCVPGPLRDQL